MTSYRELAPRQRAQVWVGGPSRPQPELVFETEQLLVEAPNWSLDGGSLVLNGQGRLWRLDLASPDHGLVAIDHDGLPELNNDHVLDPDGIHVWMSAMDGHIYRGRLDGGAVRRATPDDGAWHFLHGVSPDGTRLAYVHIEELGDPGRLALLGPEGPPLLVDTGRGHLDGPEWSSDGEWIYVNTESYGERPGHTQIARLPDGGGSMERLVTSDTVDWFPHPSPDGRHATYLSFPRGTLGHPPDLPIEVTVVATTDWSSPVQSYRAHGGQGTLNVNSWSPDSTGFAFVTYPVVPNDGEAQG